MSTEYEIIKTNLTKTMPPALVDNVDYRKQLWIGVAIAVSGASNSTNMSSPAMWANEVLKEYDRRFGY